MNVPRLSSGLACTAVAAAAMVALPLSVAPTASAATASGTQSVSRPFTVGAPAKPGSAVPADGSAAGPDAASHPVEVAVRHSGTALTEGTDVDYTVTVRNTTPDPMKHLQVSQMLSAAVQPAAISDGGRNTGTQVLWAIDLAAGQTRELHVAGHLGTRAQLAAARAQGIQVKQPHSDAAHHSADTLSSTACVQQGDTRKLLGCASDSGTVQVNPELAAAGHHAGSGGGIAEGWMWAGGAAAALGLLATAGTVLRRRGRSADAAGGAK